MSKINHIAIIPDGNRRWAQKNNVSLMESYKKSKKHFKIIADYLFENGIREITFYLLSKENEEKRSPEELNPIYKIITSGFKEEIKELLLKHEATLNIVGEQLDNIPEPISLTQRNRGVNAKTINLCINYDPFDEAFSAAKKSSSALEFKKNLYIQPPINVMIRTGGANTLSNFVPLQLGYARLYFLDVLFNDITLLEINDILSDYNATNLKYGE